jgi:urease accessory protein
MRGSRVRLLVAAAALLASGAAQAHIIGGRLGDFYAGAAHPLTDLQDILLWLSLGGLAGSLGAAKARPLILLFPLGLLAGVGLHEATRLTLDGPLVAAALLVGLGLLLAAQLHLPRALLAALAFGLALVCGASNAAAMTGETNATLFAAGVAAAGYATITLVAALTVAFLEAAGSASWRRIALRALGSWIAAIGLMMGGLAFAA